MTGDNNKDKKGFSGLSDLVSDINDIDQPLTPKPEAAAKPVASQPPHKAQQESVTHKSGRKNTTSPQSVNYGQSNSGASIKWLIGGFICICVVTGLLIDFGSQSNKKPSYNTPSSLNYTDSQSNPKPIAKTPNVTKNAELQYTMPSVGTNNQLSVPEIRWCIRKSIRIDAIRDLISTNEGVDKFNLTVNDYNSRCGKYRYRRGSQSQAERDVEPYRSQIVAEAVREAEQQKSPDSQELAAESSALAQHYSYEKQQPSPSQGKPSKAKDASTPIFNISDLDCQKSPVMCKDQAKNPVSGAVLTYEDNSLKKASTFLNGSSHGPTISFYKTGEINWITNFKNGRLDGPSIQFYEKPSGEIGPIRWIIPFSNGLAEGIRRGYYETGELKSETSYAHGKEHGFLHEFYKNGYLKSTEQYIEGKKVRGKKTFGPTANRKEHVPPRASEISAIEDLEHQALKLLNQLAVHAPVAPDSSAVNVPKEPSAQYARESR